MTEERLALPGDIPHQKQLWQLCFGDEGRYINHYYNHRYRSEETAVLMAGGELASMLTMMPLSLRLPDGKALPAAMIYAVATHPDYQGHGYGSRLMSFAHQHLAQKGVALSVLVPASESLFGFYGDRGYTTGFFLREAVLTSQQIPSSRGEFSHGLAVASAEEYNRLRTVYLAAKPCTAYSVGDITYQKSLSQNTGADLYRLDFGEVQGCAAVERLSPHKIFIKELLLPDALLADGLALLAEHLSAQEYIVRTPSWLGQDLGGRIKPFAMLRRYDGYSPDKSWAQDGYLALAYD